MERDLVCPQCGSQIPMEDVNVAANAVLCRRCGQKWNYTELIADRTAANYDPQNPPAGAWYRDLPRGFELGASMRSPGALFLIPFTCVWIGVSLGGIYGTQIADRHFDPVLSLFGIFFIVAGCFLAGTALMALCGKLIVTVDGDDGVIFTGAGPFGRRRRFNWYHVTAVRHIGATQITLDGEKQINFGKGLRREHFNFLLGMLRKKWRETGHASKPLFP